MIFFFKSLLFVEELLNRIFGLKSNLFILFILFNCDILFRNVLKLLWYFSSIMLKIFFLFFHYKNIKTLLSILLSHYPFLICIYVIALNNISSFCINKTNCKNVSKFIELDFKNRKILTYVLLTFSINILNIEFPSNNILILWDCNNEENII